MIPAVQHLHAVFSCFLIFFVMNPLIGNTVVRVLLYSVDRNPCIFLFSYIFCDESTNWEYCCESVIIFCGPQPLYFLVFLYFCDDYTNWEYCCESVIIFCGLQPQYPLIIHYLYMSYGASTKTTYGF